MPENNPPTPPAPGATPDENPTKQERSAFNKAQLAAISKTEQICAIALKDEFLPSIENDLPLDEGGITKAWITDLATQCTTARTTSALAIDATDDKRDDTVQEHGDAQVLIALLRYVQARARQKYGNKTDNLASYGIGSDILASRAVLEGWGQGIYNKTGTDTLPGVDAAKRTEIQTALTKYKATQTEQTSSQGQATRLRSQRDSFIEDVIVAGRMKIQFAADAIWPWTGEANHATRMEFQLPASRPFAG